MTDENLKNKIHEIVTRYHDENPGLRSIRVGALQHILTERYDRQITWNEIKVACDELVDENRLIFLRDSGKGGRRYCSPAASKNAIQVRKE